MSEESTVTVRCPTCGNPAEATIAWTDLPHADVRGYRCPHGCHVDAETVRNLIGAQ